MGDLAAANTAKSYTVKSLVSRSGLDVIGFEKNVDSNDLEIFRIQKSYMAFLIHFSKPYPSLPDTVLRASLVEARVFASHSQNDHGQGQWIGGMAICGYNDTPLTVTL